MTNNLKKEISDKYVVSGTLGDMFSVFCKLYGLRKDGFKKKIRLKYFTTHPEFYPLIEKLFRNIDDVSIDKPIASSSAEDNDAQVLFSIKNDNLPYIGIMANGSQDGIGQADPSYIHLEPYPEMNIQSVELPDGSYKIGIQLHSGKVGGNFKGFSLSWIVRVRKLLNKDKFDMYLFGTGDGYSVEKINQVCDKYRIRNLIGKTEFMEWVSYIKSMDFFITPEGFSAFYAMSQKIRSLVFYTDYQILGRVHPEWRRGNIILSSGQETLPGRILNRICRQTIKRNRLLAPLKPVQIYSLIWGEMS
jgi:hypothetical protein